MKRKLISLVLVLALTICMIPVSPVTVVKAATTLLIGDYVQMGKYYDEPILWRCVDIDENGPLMLSDRILTIKPFDAAGDHKYLDGASQEDTNGGSRTRSGSNLWQTSNIRSWLNSTDTAGNVTWPDGCPPTADKLFWGENDYATEAGFLVDENFTIYEKNNIKSVNQKSLIHLVDVSKLSEGGNAFHSWNPNVSFVVQNFSTAYFQNVTDKIFLLDVKQINKVYQNYYTLGSNYRFGKPTQKAVENSKHKEIVLNSADYWDAWLRSPDAGYGDPYDVRYIGGNPDSSDNIRDTQAFNDGIGVRPAFYLKESAVIIKSGYGNEFAPFIVDSQNNNPETRVKNITININSVGINLNQTFQINAIFSPVDASNKAMKWYSNNIKIATVSTSGEVTAKGPGTATITVTSIDGGFKATCKVTIIQPVISVKLNKTSISILKGKTTKLIPTINPSNASNKKVIWKSSNKSIATVSSTGTVKGIKKGSCYISVVTVDGKKSAKCIVRVK